MLLTEYNEAEVHQEFWEDGREFGREEGIENEREENRLRLIGKVQRKYLKGKDADQIADELEEDAEMIRDILDAVREAGEAAGAEEVYAILKKTETGNSPAGKGWFS